MSFFLPALLLHMALSQPAAEQSAIVVSAPGGRVDEDDAVSISSADLRQTGAPDLTGSLARLFAGVSLSEAQATPYQPNLVYRGFAASPLQGTAEGLAAYVDGARFNQPFGDTVNLDLLPDAAIKQVTIKDTSPVYGLNALGGILAIETITGHDQPGLVASALWGSNGRAEGELELGIDRGPLSSFVALQRRHDGGWRRHSPSDLLNGYADVGWDSDHAGVHLKLIGADTDLTGNGPAPIQLLAADHRGVFTYPDRTRSGFERLSLHPWVALSIKTRVQASLYVQSFRQKTLNGDISDIAPCDDMPALLCLGDERVTDIAGVNIATSSATSHYGLLNRSRTRSRSGGALVQAIDERPLFGGTNRLAVGFSYDRSRNGFESSSELGSIEADRQVSGLGSVISQADGVITPVSLISRTSYTGLFISDTLPMISRLNAELGLRWNDARIDLEDRIGTSLNGEHRFQRLNLGAELDYKFSPAFRPRIGYAQSNRAPTPAELSCASEAAPCSLSNFFLADPPLKQVTARTWETGASGRFGSSWELEWLLSAYRTVSRDDIQFVSSGVLGRAFFQNVGTTRRQGIELSTSAHRGSWTVRAGYAFTDATFRTPFILNSPDNPGADPEGRILVARGDSLPSIPRHRATISAEYAGSRVSLGGDLQIQSGQVLLGDEANLQARTKGFTMLGLHGSLRLTPSLSAFGQVQNLLDARYASFGTFAETSAVNFAEAPGASDPRSLSPGAPRRWSMGLRASF